MKAEPEFVDKCIEGLVLAFFNQGEVCTCPSRALVQEDMYEEFMQKVVERTKAIKRGNPLDTDVQVGAQASKEQFDKIMSYLEIGKQEGAEILTGATGKKWTPNSTTASTFSPPCSRAITRCGCFRRKSLARLWV